MFRKGQSGNPNGRPKGTKSKKSRQWAQLGDAIVGRHTERFNNLLDQLSDEDFSEMYLKILEYFQPKIQRTEVEDLTEKKVVIEYVNKPVSTTSTSAEDN